jgi:hypothetical protein
MEYEKAQIQPKLGLIRIDDSEQITATAVHLCDILRVYDS